MTNTTDAAYAPPFSVEDVHISPFRSKKIYEENGAFRYAPLMPRHKTTGIPLMDDFCRWLSGGGLGYDRMTFYRHNGLNVTHDIYRNGWERLPDMPSNDDFAGMVRILFGMDVTEFQTRYCVLTAQQLLIHTDLSIDEVAKRASLIGGANMDRVFRKRGMPTPKEYRRMKRKELGITDMKMYLI